MSFLKSRQKKRFVDVFSSCFSLSTSESGRFTCAVPSIGGIICTGRNFEQNNDLFLGMNCRLIFFIAVVLSNRVELQVMLKNKK